MYLLFLRNGESADNKDITMGQIVKKDGSKKDFAVIPGTVNKTEFEYGDKVVCTRGTFTVVINLGRENHPVEAITMHDQYWMPNREIVLSEGFMKEHRLEQAKLALTGVNHRVHAGRVLR